ncbi:hypothetical protein RhiJN_07699 [Ceratobasidium sp. AG-Ba]|nr:hypothetical protein RhiJN_07699 [Ceratobasidium sp. AG-Ba]QRW08527.1 hypothetical protein RhiLY_07526 [Ceratobasidium sp. AG-Ba]
MPLSSLIDNASSMVLGPNGILSVQGALLNPFTPSEPPAPTTFAQTLLLDSTSLLRGLLRSNQSIRYAIATAGPVTVISHPSTSRNVAVIRWASPANGKRTTIETEGVIITLDSWLKVTDWGSTKAVDLERRVLAVLVSRKSALGTRLKLTSTGLPHADAIILTALITVTGPHDWRRYPARGDEPVPTPLAPAAQSEHSLPTYGQAPFTRPLASLTGAALSLPTSRRMAALSVPNLTLTRSTPTSTSSPSPSSNQPVTLTLSSHQLLSGVFSRTDDNRPEIVITTIGPYTTLARYVTPDDWTAAGGEMDENGRVLKRIANIEWVSSSFKGKRLTKLRMRGQKKILDEVMYSSGAFFDNRERRFGLPNFLPWITWTEMTSTSRTSSSLSVASSPSSSVRYVCRSHPDGRPLAVLYRRLTSAGTQLELTPEGWDILDSVLVTGEEVEEGMAVGEEMVTGLDGWTSPPELVEISASGSGMYTPRHLGPGSGAVTPGGLLAVGEEGGLGVGGTTPIRSGTPVPPSPSPPPYLP